MNMTRTRDSEFHFGEQEFSKLQSLVYNQTGIVLKDHKKNMLYGRLARRLRALGYSSFKEYIKYLESNRGHEETNNLINAVTTNLTKFFREDHHFDHLRDVSLKQAADEIRAGRQQRLRVWSAGCSSGEEPYSIAMTMQAALPNLKNMDAKILATDLDTNMLEHGSQGIYKNNCYETIPKKYQKSYTEDLQDGRVQMDQRLRDLIAFKKLNLLNKFPMSGPFDAIFCRNVMIYFDTETKATLMNKFASMLRVGGWLYIGHSESLLNLDGPFKLVGRTIYRKVK